MTRTMAVRFAFGVVGESRRQAHLTTVEPGVEPSSWHTFCGLDIPADVAEVSGRPAGMPCVRCLASAQSPGLSALGDGRD